MASRLDHVKTHPETSTCYCPACTGLECLERPRWFAGQLLTEAELNSEQAYVLAKNRLHNRYLHGWGVVCGLQVVCHECEGWVTVKQGYAIDPCGDDIIVCEDHDFDVIKAIRECKEARRRRRRTDCDPLQPATDETCKDVEEHWCLTIAYEEKEARPTTALRREKVKACGCCSGNGHQCRCRCHSSHEEKATHTRASTRVRSGVGQTVAACEPTRIFEGYRLGVVPAPQMDEDPKASQPGTLRYEFEHCQNEVSKLIAQAPNVANMSPSEAYQACCQYRDAVRNFLTEAPMARCELFDLLSRVQCPSLPEDPPSNYPQIVAQAVQQLKVLLVAYLFDCLCLKLLPVCSPDPKEDRLILACLTVKGDKIVRICHYEGRRHVITFPTLAYWLSVFPIGSTLSQLLRALCCGDLNGLSRLLGRSTYQKATLTTAGMSNPGMLYQTFASTLGQMVGADVVAAAVPERMAEILDARPLVGRKVETVRAELKERKIQFTERPVDWWPEEAVVASELYAPAAFSVHEPLTVYTKGDLVVGFDVPDETQRLRLEVDELRKRLDALERPIE